MTLTAVMSVVLCVSFALMFGLVKFTENIITRPAAPSAEANAVAESIELDPQT